MKLCLLQTDIAWNAPLLNMERATVAIVAHPDCDFFVLPEMWSTGFETHPTAETIAAGVAAQDWMASVSKMQGIVIAGSLPLAGKGGAGYRNAFVLANRGCLSYYNKHHLFTYGEEHRAYTAGQERVVVEVKGWRVLLQVCYDLRFPVFSRSRGGDYDMAIYVANWPASRRQAWDTLLRARAIENLCYVCGVNRVGSDPACSYNGGSALISPRGDTLLALGNAASAATIELTADDLAALRRFRQKFPALADADDFRLSGCTDVSIADVAATAE